VRDPLIELARIWTEAAAKTDGSAPITPERGFPQAHRARAEKWWTERDFLLPPWSVEELEACFFVSDATGQKLAYVYFEDDPGRRTGAKLLTKDEAHRIAVRIENLRAHPSALLALGEESESTV
jgi:hypothetical protein